jgi:hypothetical protein
VGEDFCNEIGIEAAKDAMTSPGSDDLANTFHAPTLVVVEHSLGGQEAGDVGEQGISRARGEIAPEGMANIEQIIHGMPPEMSAVIARQETVGACAIALLAAVNEGLGTCLHSCHGADKIEDVRRVLKLPQSWNTVWVQLVGHPLEDREACGQRPRLPFGELFFDMDPTRPFEREETVVKELEREGLLRAPSPKPGRFEELMRIGRKLGYPI